MLNAILAGEGVAGVGNAKGIEMLLDFAGLLELYRATGEEKYLRVIQIAWEDIASHHLYITGSASTGEYFPKDFTLPNEGLYMIGETCVSMGWMYLNFSLARLTGDTRYLDMAEQTLYNPLIGAQSPDGERWAYIMWDCVTVSATTGISTRNAARLKAFEVLRLPFYTSLAFSKMV